MPNDTFDPARAFTYLESSGAVSALPVTEGFWPGIMAGRIKLDDGHLMITGDVTDDIGHWENHPEGEEILHRLSGAFDLLIEGSDAPAPRLGEQGMEVLHDEARSLLRDAGASIDGENVLFDPAMVEEMVALAPDHVTLHARNPARNVTIAPGKICNAAVGGPAFATDLERGRRNANLEDMKNFSRLI